MIPTVFRIDRTHSKLVGLEDSHSIILQMLIESHTKRDKAFDASFLNITAYKKEDIQYYLYTYTVDDKESDWADFLPSELKGDESFKQTKVNLILFMETDHELLAIFGGTGYLLIATFIDHLFGLTTYDRIISLEKDEAVSTKSRTIAGQRAGISEQYRDDYRMINYLEFGKVPKELHIKLANETSLTHFEFLLNKSTERLQITAGRGFKISKDVDFDLLHRLSIELNIITSLAPKELLSSYLNITDKFVLTELKKLLNEKVYNNIAYIINQSNDPRDIFEFEFCNPNKIEEFYEAEHYELVEPSETNKRKDGLFATVFNKNEIFKTVLEKAYTIYGNNQSGLINYLYSVNIHACIGKKSVASSGFMYHFNAEFTFNGESVFLVDGKWYILKESFIESLKNQTERVLKNSKLTSTIIDEPWTYDVARKLFSNEEIYNMLYNGRPNYIVLDRIIADGVELCDILFITDVEIYLIHVKHSFTARVRELTNQILISARRLTEAISSKQKVFFDKLYNGLKAKGRSTNNYSQEEFFELFLTRKPIYVFATASHLDVDVPIESNIDKYDSNIARFSLTTTSAEMQTSYYELKTHQILRA
ncbi:DUF6119 family protein [Mucilaginibacter ginkgonis]|uniref:TIGR04141 family sporadically distributed protein n=1 Tax=Mucilaginibacter ginkgonis TaxID=2682091 RepID=A0A6I4IMT3_9SPHI|nr:DUF6119 family protein [Mucilaginibacter ginkgonis]QQL50123.1 TIGR04141 family sporadically distributed protein [Mucilaginibacter ginkgonis]